MKTLKLNGMAKALEQQMELKEVRELSFDERIAMLVEAEALDKENKKTNGRLRNAKLRLSACLEDVKVKQGRGIDRSLIATLATCNWIRDKRNMSITAPTGGGKTFLSCALAHTACRQGFTAAYYRAHVLFDDLAIAKGDGTYNEKMTNLESRKLLILDDFGLEKLAAENRRDLFEIMERRYDRGSTLIASQFEVDLWHDIIGDPTLADAILDRFVHNSYAIKLKGETMRDPKNQKG
jgi:DNA replication protein DnaC